MKIKSINNKGINSLKTGFNFLTVYEGAVRSGKTVVSLMKFYGFVLLSRDTTFLMSGHTLGSISRNCINGDFGLIAISGKKLIPKTDTDGNKFLLLTSDNPKHNGKRIYYCGADNERSFKKIRGFTIGGWYADEIQLHDPLFVETALQRSISAIDRFNIWTLNPDVPTHWIYTKHLDHYEKNGIKGYKYYHYIIDDNPALNEERKNELKTQYPEDSVWYKRFILGLRVRAEGSCYPSFKDNHIINKIPEGFTLLYTTFGVDIGGNKSATSYTHTGFFLFNKTLYIIALDELYDKENKDVESILYNYEQFIVDCKNKWGRLPADCYVDSNEQLIRKSMAKVSRFNVKSSLKKEVNERIRMENMLFGQDRLLIMDNCVHLINSFKSAIWDTKSLIKDKRLDNFTYNVDSLDSFEYSFESRFNDIENICNI